MPGWHTSRQIAGRWHRRHSTRKAYLDPLEVAGQLPVGDHRVGLGPLLAGRVEQVMVHLGTERLGCHLARLEAGDITTPVTTNPVSPGVK